MLFDITNAQISKLIIHKIGSRNDNTENTYSERCVEFKEDNPVLGLLKQYFLATFNEPNLYHFTATNGDLNSNIVYQSANSIFDSKDTFYQYSRVLADSLLEKSSHPNIKPGEFYLAMFEGVQIFDQEVRCLGLFKSETKETFLRIMPNEGTIDIDCEEGINIKKLDKGCLIFEVEHDNGYVVSVVDKVSKSNEAVFWKNDFLNVEPREDNNYDTQNYLNICKEFVDQVYAPVNDVPRESQIDMKNRTIDYFKTKETFSEDQFKNEVLENDDVKKAFDEYKQNYQQENGVNLNNQFTISNDVVRQENKKFKSVLKLDKNFHIYIHGNQALIERGFDNEKQLYFYKLFFQTET